MAHEPEEGVAVHQGRTAQEVEDHLDALGPVIICNPQEIHRAITANIAAILAELEAIVFTMHSRRFICEADGEWLDAHGLERSVPRIPGEVDADYAIRIKNIEDRLTRPVILAAVDVLLNVGTSRMEEWFEESCYSDIQDTRGFTETCATHSELRGFTVFIQLQVQTNSNRCFPLDVPEVPLVGTPTGTHCFVGTDAQDASQPGLPINASLGVYAYADGVAPVAGEIYPRIRAEVDRLRAGGLGPFPHFIVQIEP